MLLPQLTYNRLRSILFWILTIFGFVGGWLGRTAKVLEEFSSYFLSEWNSIAWLKKIKECRAGQII